MSKYFSKIQKTACIFFIALGCLMSNSMLIRGAEPAYSFDTTEIAVDKLGATVQFSFHFTRKSYDKTTGTAEYNVTSSFCIDKRTQIYTDYLYVNDGYVGAFSSNNGWQNAKCYDRSEGYSITLHEGLNTISTKGTAGTAGGNTSKDIYIDKFSEITATFKDWDGTEIDKKTIHIGECPTYPSDPTRYGYTFTGWDLKCGDGGMKQDTTFTAQYRANIYNIVYHGNGATGGSTANQTANYDQWFNLSPNGFVRQYTVSYNGNGGTPTKSNDIANATFLHWTNDGGSTYANQAYVGNLTATDNDTINMYAQWQLGSIKLPTGTRQGYKLIYWKNSSGQKVGEPNTTYTPTQDETLIAVWDKAPTITATNKTFYEGEYTATYWKNTLRWQGLKANDQEDGNLTSKIKIVSDNVNVNKHGTYKVVYSVTDSVGQTSTATSTVTVKYNNPPVITAYDQTFYEGQYTDTYWKNTLRWKDVSASDVEDGKYPRDRIKIMEDTVNVNKPGTYKVTYKVTDNFGKSATKTVKITVKYNNPPTIKAEDRWFYVSEDVNEIRLKEYVIAQDIEDGVYTDKARIKIIANNVQNHVIGDYKVTYKITDNFGKSAQTTANIHIVKDIPTGDEYAAHLRFISKKHINTLKSNSIWRTSGFKELLNGSLNKTQHTQAREHWHLTAEDIKRIQTFNDSHDWSKASNQAFLAEFRDLLQ